MWATRTAQGSSEFMGLAQSTRLSGLHSVLLELDYLDDGGNFQQLQFGPIDSVSSDDLSGVSGLSPPEIRPARDAAPQSGRLEDRPAHS